MSEQDEKLVQELTQTCLEMLEDSMFQRPHVESVIRQAITRTRKQVWMEAAKDCENRMEVHPTLDGMIIRRILDVTARRFRKIAETP